VVIVAYLGNPKEHGGALSLLFWRAFCDFGLSIRFLATTGFNEYVCDSSECTLSVNIGRTFRVRLVIAVTTENSSYLPCVVCGPPNASPLPRVLCVLFLSQNKPVAGSRPQCFNFLKCPQRLGFSVSASISYFLLRFPFRPSSRGMYSWCVLTY